MSIFITKKHLKAYMLLGVFLVYKLLNLDIYYIACCDKKQILFTKKYIYNAINLNLSF